VFVILAEASNQRKKELGGFSLDAPRPSHHRGLPRPFFRFADAFPALSTKSSWLN